MIAFLNTPEYATFSNTLGPGASLTGITIRVVVADYDFLPQTEEALKFAQKPGAPVVIDINKANTKWANIDRVKVQMQARGIAHADWSGDTLCLGISALKGTNIDK
jgi:translation initiation factor IF-2